jgi:hypothetical protein
MAVPRAGSSWYSRVSSQVRDTSAHFMLEPYRRRALELLAASPEGCTEALMFANGFTAELLSSWCGLGSRLRTPSAWPPTAK